jgi:hypothetical protein
MRAPEDVGVAGEQRAVEVEQRETGGRQLRRRAGATRAAA